MAGGVDLSATVGWFTTYFPVRLDLGPVDPVQAQRGGPAIGAALKRVKEQVRAVPDSGLGYGLLRYLNPDTCGALAALPEPALAFNYLGRFRAPSGQPWELAGQTATFRLPPQDDRAVRVGLDVNAMVLDGAHGPDLHITVDWPDALIPRATVEDLLARWDQALRGLSEHADEPSAGGHTPSDHPLVPLTQEDLDEFEGHVE